MSITAEFRTHVVDTQPLGGCSPEEILASVERIVTSDGFTGSAQLVRFLRYVVESCLGGQAGLLKESSIGVAVFNRGGGYDPKTDPIVRVEARRLRARLAAYYETAGATDNIRISLPKGGYAPAFGRLQYVSPEAEAAGLNRGGYIWTAAVVFAIIVAAVGAAYYRVKAPERLAAQFWQSLLGGEKPVLIVAADSGLVMYQDLTHQGIGLSEYLTGEYRTQAAGSGSPVTALAGRRYTSIADLEFASRLSGRPEAARRGVRTRYARDVRMDDLKGGSVILLGARHSNPWVELFEKDATLRLAHDEASRVFRVVNRSPQGAEAAEIVVSPEELKKEIYGIITYHANREGSGKVLVVAGTSVTGTEAAANLLLDPERLQPWLEKASLDGELRGFDLLVRDRNLAGGAPQAEVVAFHVERLR